MAEYPFEHCQPDDPDVCQACVACSPTVHYKKIPGADHCPRHGGYASLKKNERQAANQYRLERWQRRLGEFTQSENVKSLRDEIGILRIVLEETLNKCQDSNELLLYSSKISNLAVNIEKLVVSCDRLERNMGLLLDKSAALALASKVVEVIAENVDDPVKIDNISEGIINILSELTNEPRSSSPDR